MISICFISCYFNHHQKPVCDVLYKITNGHFNFVATEKVSEWRKKFGYKEITSDYVIDCDTDEKKDYVKEIIQQADVVVTDAEDLSLTRQRLSEGKLTFRFCERLFKSKLRYLKAPLHIIKALKTKEMYLLCNSAYTAGDFKKMGFFGGKSFKWGYFPEVRYYEPNICSMKGQSCVSILWAGRLIDWKHPEYALYAAKYLKNLSVPFTMNIIGSGKLLNKMEKYIHDYNLESSVNLLGSMSPENVREYMENSDVFLFTSDRSEGWGVVLNEAMNSGCAIIANRSIGSVPYLIKDGVSGLTYQSRSQFIENVVKVAMDSGLRTKLQKEAYNTIINTWNAENAAKQLVELSMALLDGKQIKIADGPCSQA